MWYFVGTIFRALSDAIPDQVQAFTALPTLIDLYGSDPDGGVFTDHICLGGGQGASARQDGKSGVIWPTSAASTAIELVEARIPVVVLEKSLIPGSAGAGTHRGAGGYVRCFRHDGPTHEYQASTMVDLGDGEIIEVLVGGGAGFAPPDRRAASAIARDA